ncbi:hypothetical protein NHJ13051_009483 [Beauveria bassiana]
MATDEGGDGDDYDNDADRLLPLPSARYLYTGPRCAGPKSHQ